MIQPQFIPLREARIVKITCFICIKDYKIHLRPLQSRKKVACPDCNKKEVIINQ